MQLLIIHGAVELKKTPRPLILNNTRDGPLFPALFSLNMLLGTPDEQSYSEEQLTGMLKDAGEKKSSGFISSLPMDPEF